MQGSIPSHKWGSPIVCFNPVGAVSGCCRKSARSTVEWDARERWEAKPGGEQVRREEAAGSGEQR